MPDKRRVVYLFGTGASQAEISRKNPDVRILMGDIAEGIQKRIDKDNIELLEEVKNELAGKNVDVEHLITLYASSGTSNHIQIANELRRLFREEIQNRIGMLGSTFSPRLITALIDMYNIPELDEDLVGILTLNYDDLTDRACQMVYGGVNYLIEIESGDSRLDTNSKATPLIKLHGSFNWKNEF
ncbi:MAG: hypothetical protein KAU03_02735, partial [Candidatus Altiarchaeales archaeon]|nr:hypothetical protein [Candidatus Altiarchaeales archaeon]